MQNALVRKKAASALHVAAFLLINFFPTDLSIVIYIKIAVADLDILRIQISVFPRMDEEYEPLSFAVRKFERNLFPKMLYVPAPLTTHTLTFNQIQHPLSALVRPNLPWVPHRWSLIHLNDVQPFIPLNVMPLINVF